MTSKYRLDAAGLAQGLGASYATKYAIVFAAAGALFLWIVVDAEVPDSETTRSWRDWIFSLTFRVASVIGAFVGGFVATATSRRKGILTGVCVGAAIVALRIAYYLVIVSWTREIPASELTITAAVIPLAWLGARFAERRRTQERRSVELSDGWKQPSDDGQAIP